MAGKQVFKLFDIFYVNNICIELVFFRLLKVVRFYNGNKFLQAIFEQSLMGFN